MPMSILYDTHSWRELRSRLLGPDAECALAGLAGECRGPLNVHHNKPLADGGAPFPDDDGLTVLCARHHQIVHSWLQEHPQRPQWKRCTHHHPYPSGREECERRLNAA